MSRLPRFSENCFLHNTKVIVVLNFILIWRRKLIYEDFIKTSIQDRSFESKYTGKYNHCSNSFLKSNAYYNMDKVRCLVFPKTSKHLEIHAYGTTSSQC